MTATAPSPVVPALTKRQARHLTTRIASAATDLWQLLAEAHDREAWRALGYPSWAAYVDSEFQISRGQAFRLLDRARVVSALGEATGDPEAAAAAVSARQAAVLRHEPVKAAKRVAKAVAKGTDVVDAVAREVDRVRSPQTSKTGHQEGGDPTGTPTQPGARGGAAATAEKVAEAPTAAPKPTRSSAPQRGGDVPPPAAPPAGGPATADGVRHMVAMITTTGADVIAHCASKQAILDAVKTLRTALVTLEAGDRGAAARSEHPRPAPLARRDVTPIPKSTKR